MPDQLTRFRVTGLHGSKTIDVPFEDGHLVLVGENGTGKSTFANLIYYFLTRQWSRLVDFTFATLEAHFQNTRLVLTPEDLTSHLEARRNWRLLTRARHLASRRSLHLLEQLTENAEQFSPSQMAVLMDRLAAETNLPKRMLQQITQDVLKETPPDKKTHIQELQQTLGTLETGQFLYLPTYRRIEHDLRAIFRGVDIESELRQFRDRLSDRVGATYIELVEFGMEDVEHMIAARMNSIKEDVRSGLDNLTGTYLRDVIRGIHTTVDVQRISNIKPTSLDSVFARIDESVLPIQDKERLREKMASISSADDITEPDKVIAHFLFKLLQFYAEQQDREKNIGEFVRICNKYLTGKQLVWDNTRYKIFIAGDVDEGDNSGTLEMKALSSGEKQIVSLFSHLYLSGETHFFVIIDEPELSLSVPWQRTFLPDILSTEMCSSLVAVTHSPFIWENECEPFVRSIGECTTSYSESNTRLVN